MKNIFILVPQSAVPEAISNPRYLFTAANQFLRSKGRPALFNVQLVGLRKEVRLSEGAFSVHADKLLSRAGQADLVVIPALFGDLQAAVDANRETIPWIINQHQNGAEIASLCVGAFLLAETGLLDGQACSTHWAFQAEFRERFPRVALQEGNIITQAERVYTSGGANSYWNLLLYLLEKYTDREIAIMASKYFAIDIDRESQSAFIMFTGQKNHNDQAIKNVQSFIEGNFQEKLTVTELANKAAISRRSFERRFKSATRNTVIEYIQRVRIEAAKKSFEATRKNVAEVMDDVGYADTKSFRTVFKKVTGLTPLAYRNKYNRQLAS